MLLRCHVPALIRGSSWKCGSLQTPVTNTDMDHWIRLSSGHSLSQLLLSSWSNLTDLVGCLEEGGLGDKGQILVKYPEWIALWMQKDTPTPTPPRTHTSCLSPGEVRSVDYKVTKKTSDRSELSCGWCVAGTILCCSNATCMKFVIILLCYLSEVRFYVFLKI